jgi:hypothetical protein
MSCMTASFRSFVYTLTGVESGSWAKNKNPARHIRPLSGLVSVALNKGCVGTENLHRRRPPTPKGEKRRGEEIL